MTTLYADQNDWTAGRREDASRRWWNDRFGSDAYNTEVHELRRRRRKGPASLVDLCVNEVAKNIANIHEEQVAGLAAPLLRRLWQVLWREKNITFKTWKLFSKPLVSDVASDIQNKAIPLEQYRYTNSRTGPHDDLTALIKPLRSPASDFLVFLTIRELKDIGEEILMDLADFKNLSLLEFNGPHDSHADRVGDRLVRGWSEKTSPFPALKVLRITDSTFLSEQSFCYVSKFPSLCVYDISVDINRRIQATARAHGWKSTLGDYLGSRDPLTYRRCLDRFLELVFGRRRGSSAITKGVVSPSFDERYVDHLYPVPVRLSHYSEHPEPGLETSRLEEIWDTFMDGEDPSHEESGQPSDIGLGEPLGNENNQGSDSEPDRSQDEEYWESSDPYKKVDASLWAIMVYALVDHLDLRGGAKARMIPLRRAKPLPLPPKPFVTLELQKERQGDFHGPPRILANYTFYRSPMSDHTGCVCNTNIDKQPSTERKRGNKNRGANPRKRQNMGDMLNSFAG